jgi:hypothetical protein
MSDFGDTRWPIARKDHRCEWCGVVIPAGTKHAQFAGRWDGEWQNWRMHSECYHDASENKALADGFTPYENERPIVASEGD